MKESAKLSRWKKLNAHPAVYRELGLALKTTHLVEYENGDEKYKEARRPSETNCHLTYSERAIGLNG